LLIVALLTLGGVLSTLGDRLGSRVGKARLSLFNLRPRRTAVLITVLTGSLISALSLALMLLVSERLRTGLFELERLEQSLRDSRAKLSQQQAALQQADNGRRLALAGLHEAEQTSRRAEQRAQTLRRELRPLQEQRRRLEQERARLSRDVQQRDTEIRRTEAELAVVRQKISAGEKELKTLEDNLIALRRGDVVISSGLPLATAKVRLQRPDQAREVITALLQQANRQAFARVLPGQPPDSQILLVARGDISKLEQLLIRPGSWVVSILSAANVLKGEKQVLAFPDIRPNREVVAAGDVLASTSLDPEDRSAEQVRRRLNMLLTAAYARAQRQGTLTDGLQYDLGAFSQLVRRLSERPPGQAVALEAVALRAAETPDPIVVELRLATPRP
jgi:uncharacterized protein (DUF3084 family)